jgi:hypothetical protein
VVHGRVVGAGFGPVVGDCLNNDNASCASHVPLTCARVFMIQVYSVSYSDVESSVDPRYAQVCGRVALLLHVLAGKCSAVDLGH